MFCCLPEVRDLHKLSTTNIKRGEERSLKLGGGEGRGGLSAAELSFRAPFLIANKLVESQDQHNGAKKKHVKRQFIINYFGLR